jgi:hypothetical protein
MIVGQSVKHFTELRTHSALVQRPPAPDVVIPAGILIKTAEAVT